MKNTFTLFLLLILNHCFAQNSDLEKEVAIDIIEHRPIRNGEIRLINRMSAHEDYFIKKIDYNKGIVYDQKTKINPDSIHLTVKERDYLAIEFRKDTDNFVWEKADLKPYVVIPVEDALSFMKENKTNAVINISHPLFIRNNSIALVYFTYDEYHNNSYSSLILYKKIKGVWRSWISIRDTALEN